MENWGLITYRETALLYNPLASSNGDKEWVATVIAHELAHMVLSFIILIFNAMTRMTTSVLELLFERALANGLPPCCNTTGLINSLTGDGEIEKALCCIKPAFK